MNSATTTPRKNPFVSPFTKRNMDADLARIASEGGTAYDMGSMLYEKYNYTVDGYEPPAKQPKTAFVPDVNVSVPGVSGSLPLSFTLGALQGLTFGTGIAGMGSLIGWADGKGAQAGRDEVRQLYSHLEEQYPGKTMAGEVAGMGMAGAATGATNAIATAMRGAGRLARVGTSTALGAGGAAAFAAGETPGGVAERSEAALSAAGPGAVAGGVLAVSPMVALMTLGAGAGALSSPESPLQGAAIGAGTTLVGAKSAPRLAKPLTDFIAKMRGIAHADGSTGQKARTYLADLITREHGSIQNAMAKVDVAEASGAPIAVADLLGPDAPAVLAQLEATRSPAVGQLVRQLQGRQDGQQGRIMQQLMRSFRLGTSNAHDAAELLVARMDDESAPLFAAAWEDVVPVDDRLRNLLSVPRLREAYSRGRTLDALRIAEETGGAGRTQFPSLPELKEAPAIVQRPEGFEATSIPELPEDLSTLTSLPVRAIHYIKRGVRDMASAAERSSAAMSQDEQRYLFGLAGQARALAAEASANYRGANAIFGGHAQSATAVQMGKGGRPILDNKVIKDVGTRPRFVNRTPEDVRADLADMDPADKPLYILGAMQDVDELLSSQLGRDPKLLAKLGLYGDATRETRFTKTVRALFDDEHQANELIERLRNEARLVRAPTRTASLAIQEFKDMTAQAERDASLAAGRVPGALGRVINTVGAVLKPAGAGGPDPLLSEFSDEVSNLLLGGVNGYGEARATVNGLLGYVPKVVTGKPYRPLVPLAGGQQVGQRTQKAPQ